MKMKKTTISMLTLLGTTMLATSAFAQDAVEPQQAGEDQLAQAPAATQPSVVSESQAGLSDIIVTARRRAEPLQQTPVAISAIDSARLAEARVTNISDVTTLAPSITLARNSTNPVSLFPFIRGFGTKSSDPAQEPPIALTIDEIYQAQLIGAYINLFDVEAVEVLRGPQGTVLGKNSPAGGVAVRTRRPKDEFGGLVQADYGSFDNVHLRGYVDAPLVPGKLLATVSANYQNSDGYMRNILTGKRLGGIDLQSYRVGLLAHLGETVDWYVTGQIDFDKGEDAGNRNVSTTDRLVVPGLTYVVPPPVTLTCTAPYSASLCDSALPITSKYKTRAAPQPKRDSRNLSLASNLNVDAGPVGLAVVTGYRHFREVSFSDIDGTELGIIDSGYDGNYRSFSHEMRLSSNDGEGLDLDGRLNWLVGIYFFNYEYDRFNDQVILGNRGGTYQEGSTNSYAIFGRAEYEVADGFSLSAGGRQTWDRKKHLSCGSRCLLGLQADISERASWNNFSYDLTANYNFTPNNMIYLRYATGYRGGGFTGVPATVAASSIADPETVKAWELGLKNDFFDNRLRVNVSIFQNKFQDLQRVVTESTDIPPFFIQKLRNAAKAKTQGVEVEMQARPVDALTLRGSVGYLDAKYTDFVANVTGVEANGASDLSFLKFPYTSKWTASFGATYDLDLGTVGSVSFTGDYAYRSSYYTTDLNYPFSYQDGVGVLSGKITWRDVDDRLSVSVWGRNLTDEFYIDGGDPVASLTTYVSDAPPREVGVSVGYRF